jgi:UMF1 family MFS transporter
MMFGLSVRLGSYFVPEGASSQYWGILGITLILLVGLILIIPVKAEKAHLDTFEE